ncbi:tRNA glutamyl-Q(34) synthetase GluQRS [Motiliproteus sediminis]|uniref:tRNA glutamyl-Q(34) synthetase GluQRS n=1 Tax=Motiliproteus sediminis TaxID=1468178 RepID=UPI001AEFEB6A|nr:tRNA glutamyl-Q(34) synthetase GluQRS [Motiliproteus sediminis]
MTCPTGHYIGRFAPSPTGALHFGSLMAAVASFLDARAHQGQWLVRIEDLDPPREQPGASDQILRTLERYGLLWDGKVLYQSQRHALYRDTLQRLLRKGLAYRCDCSRQQIAARGGRPYDGHCRLRQAEISEPAAIRAVVDDRPIGFVDRIQGPQQFQFEQGSGDFILFRRDGFFAYQLAVVVDDHAQGINQIVRGSDLLDSTPHQRHLQQQLDLARPHYAHIPVMVNQTGQKLSKQTFATALDPKHPSRALHAALQVLGQQPPAAMRNATPAELLSWAITHWHIDAVPARMSVSELALKEQG